MSEEKKCTTCNILKPLESFSKDKKRKDGFCPGCKDCHKKYNDENAHVRKAWRESNKANERAKHYKNKYNITINDYESMLEKQNYACAICSSKTSKTARSEFLSVDHCHTTGKVRGLLCDRCNVGIGSLEDSPELLLKAAAYISKNKEVNDERQ